MSGFIAAHMPYPGLGMWRRITPMPCWPVNRLCSVRLTAACASWRAHGRVLASAWRASLEPTLRWETLP